MDNIKVGIVMGSDSDWDVMQHACAVMEEFAVPYEKRIVSAHRTPDLLYEYASSATSRGLQAIIAGAGGAAHLPGMLASVTSLPVIGGTSPITTVGTVLTAAIEVLSMVILTQLLHPGHPVLALATALGMDMRSGRAVKACPEAMLANALSAQFITDAY